MQTRIGKLILATLIAIVSACQSQPIQYYAPPANLAPSMSATIVGSQVTVKSILFADEITFVLAIDGFAVAEGAKSYASPIQLSPGTHVVQVGFLQGTGCAKAGFDLDVEIEQGYVARAEKLARKGIFRKQNVKIWIEDSEGNQVTEQAVVPFDYCGGGFGLIVI
jgi:hypothetical protein